MKTVEELKAELWVAKYHLRGAERVDWGSGGSGMTRYDEKLAVVTRLTVELNRALKAG